jgi:hypothetical protein
MPKHAISKSSQLRGRRVARIGNANVAENVAEMVFPVLGKGCLQQPQDIGRAMCQRRTKITSAGRSKNAARLLAHRVLWLAARMADLLGRAEWSSPEAL